MKEADKNIDYTATIVTFALFFTEAIIHYNIRAKKAGYFKDSKKKGLEFPSGKPLVSIILTVGAFSLLNGYLVNQLKKK